MTNLNPVKKTPYGYQRVQVEIREGSKLQLFSQNFCDPTTWFTQSVRYTDVILDDSGDGYRFNLPDGYTGPIADVTHGKISKEFLLKDDYDPVLKVDGYVLVENCHSTDKDYDVYYDDGYVVLADYSSGSTVEFDYSQVTTSEWCLTPDANKLLRITAAELQFSSDARLTDTFIFQPRADVAKHPLLASYWDSNDGPYPAGTMLPLGDPTKYQSVLDIINEAYGAYPVIPKTKGENLTWRDQKEDVQVFRWEYENQASIDLSSNWGMDIEIKLEKDIPCTGWVAIVTFYGVSEDDDS